MHLQGVVWALKLHHSNSSPFSSQEQGHPLAAGHTDGTRTTVSQGPAWPLGKHFPSQALCSGSLALP